MGTEEEVQVPIDYLSIANSLNANGKFIYSYENVLDKYDELSNDEFSSLIWLFKYYDEIFTSLTTETQNLEQAIKDGITSVSGDAVSEKMIKEHKIFKNLLFNIKQVMYLDENHVFKEMTYEDLQILYQKENFFTIGKIDMGDKLKTSLSTLGFAVESDRGIATAKHDVMFKYFILSSEQITLSQYIDILKQDRSDEQPYENSFHSTGEEVPEFTQESDISFTYLKSNYVYQSKNGRMSLKGVNEELNSTETTTDTSVVSSTDTGYYNV